jgi:hypothetical protein
MALVKVHVTRSAVGTIRLYHVRANNYDYPETRNGKWLFQWIVKNEVLAY